MFLDNKKKISLKENEFTLCYFILFFKLFYIGLNETFNFKTDKHLNLNK